MSRGRLEELARLSIAFSKSRVNGQNPLLSAIGGRRYRRHGNALRENRFDIIETAALSKAVHIEKFVIVFVKKGHQQKPPHSQSVNKVFHASLTFASWGSGEILTCDSHRTAKIPIDECYA